MAKAKPGAKKSQPASSASKSNKPKGGMLKAASSRVAKVAAKLVKSVAKVARPADKAASKVAPKLTAKLTEAKGAGKKAVAAKPAGAASTKAVVVAAKAAPVAKVATALKAAPAGTKAPPPPPAAVKGGKTPKSSPASSTPAPERQKPRATKLPPVAEALTTREMEQILTIGQGRGVAGEGSVKGRLVVKDGLPTLKVLGRDKRELLFILQGPDQEVLPAYVDHKVSVSGYIKKVHSEGGTVDVRKYAAKKPDLEAPAEAVVAEQKLRFLSPGEVEQVCNAGMGAGMRGFASVRGNLELTGEDFILVLSNGGTRHQVSFLLEGKIPKGLRKNLGQQVQVTGVLDKSSGWGGKVGVEVVEVKPSEFRSVSRESLEMVHIEGAGDEAAAEVRLNHGLTVRLPERAGYTWAIEPTTAKRVGLREANFELAKDGTASREFFFTPRNPGAFDVEFFLAKAFTPANVARTFKLALSVKPS